MVAANGRPRDARSVQGPHVGSSGQAGALKEPSKVNYPRHSWPTFRIPRHRRSRRAPGRRQVNRVVLGTLRPASSSTPARRSRTCEARSERAPANTATNAIVDCISEAWAEGTRAPPTEQRCIRPRRAQRPHAGAAALRPPAPPPTPCRHRPPRCGIGWSSSSTRPSLPSVGGSTGSSTFGKPPQAPPAGSSRRDRHRRRHTRKVLRVDTQLRRASSSTPLLLLSGHEPRALL